MTGDLNAMIGICINLQQRFLMIFHDRYIRYFKVFLFSPLQAGIAAAPARAVSAVKEMNIPQRIKDIKLPDLPHIGGLRL